MIDCRYSRSTLYHNNRCITSTGTSSRILDVLYGMRNLIDFAYKRAIAVWRHDAHENLIHSAQDRRLIYLKLGATLLTRIQCSIHVLEAGGDISSPMANRLHRCCDHWARCSSHHVVVLTAMIVLQESSFAREHTDPLQCSRPQALSRTHHSFAPSLFTVIAKTHPVEHTP